MQTLQIILTLANITCYGAMTFLAAFAFVRLKRQEKYICDIHRDVHTTLMLTLGLHMRRNFDDLKEMESSLQRLIEDEEYERAEQMKTVITRRKAELKQEISKMEKIFGVKVDITEL